MNLFFLLQQTLPDTTGYMIAGFAVIFGVMGLYLISIAVRRRNLKQDMQVLQELEDNSGDN
jgi:hypothetical protein